MKVNLDSFDEMWNFAERTWPDRFVLVRSMSPDEGGGYFANIAPHGVNRFTLGERFIGRGSSKEEALRTALYKGLEQSAGRDG